MRLATIVLTIAIFRYLYNIDNGDLFDGCGLVLMIVGMIICMIQDVVEIQSKLKEKV